MNKNEFLDKIEDLLNAAEELCKKESWEEHGEKDPGCNMWGSNDLV